MKTLGLVDDDLFFEHAAPYGHPEREARLSAARRGVEAAAAHFLLRRTPPRDATEAELTSVHDQDLVAFVAATSGTHGYFDADTYYCERSYDAARRAAGGCVALVDALDISGSAGGIDYGLALVRPPGHHATAHRSMGFCFFNSVAVAARAAQRRGLQRVAIVDWDVHHGNGTQDIFYDDPSVLYLSAHQSPQYPGTGSASEQGTANGSGFTVNLPLSAGATDAVYQAVFERVVCPVIEQFEPDLLLVSAGYDAHARDSLGGMAVSNAGFGAMTHLLLNCMPQRGTGRVVFVLEGGYDEQGIEGSVKETLLAVADPLSEFSPTELLRDRQAELDALLEIHGRHWDL